MALRGREQERAFFARRGKPRAGRKVPLVRLGQVLHQTAPHGEHKVVLVEDCRRVANRIYDIKDNKGKIGILGSELESLSKWWQRERKRKGTDLDPESEANRDSVKAGKMGYGDAMTQIQYALDRGGTLKEGIRAHRAYCRTGDLFTHEHGDDAAFIAGAKNAYRELSAKAQTGRGVK